jgi:hypothetical protein
VKEPIAFNSHGDRGREGQEESMDGVEVKVARKDPGKTGERELRASHEREAPWVVNGGTKLPDVRGEGAKYIGQKLLSHELERC